MKRILNSRMLMVFLGIICLLAFSACSSKGSPITDGGEDGGGGDSGPDRPAQPSSVAATQGTIIGKVTITWAASTGADSYNVYRSDSDGGAYSKLNTTGVAALTYDDSTVTAGVHYFFKASAVNIAGESGLSSPAQGWSTAAPTPGGSGALTQTDSFNNNVAIKWEAATDPVTAQNELQYLMYYSTSANIDTVENAEANGTAVGDYTADLSRKAATALTPLTGYYLNVLVKNNAGLKAAYTMKSVTTGNTPMSTTNGNVKAIAVDGNTIYIGGSFTRAGKPASGGVILNASTGATPVNTLSGNVARLPAIGNQSAVYASVPDGKNGWFIGGLFSEVNGVARNNLAHVTADGVLYDWNPNANDYVETIAVSGNTVYVGGEFTTIGAVGVVTRNYIAALDATTGAVITGWDADADGLVSSIAVDDDKVYAVGNFGNIGGAAQNYIAALNTTDGAVIPGWAPVFDRAVYSIAVSGDKIYVGGSFTAIDLVPRNYAAALSAATGVVDVDWDPDADSDVYVIAVNGDTVYAGGAFGAIGGETRGNIAALNTTDGHATLWDPDADSEVLTIAVNGGVVYAGGSFKDIGGVARENIAAIDATTGDVIVAWNPGAGGEVDAISFSGENVYIGGAFTTFGGAARKNIAAINATTGDVTDWNPEVITVGPVSECHVNTIAVSGDHVYVGGRFTNIGAAARKNLADIDAATGLASNWQPDPDHDDVFALAVSGDTVYVGGDFTTLAGQARNRIAAFTVSTGAIKSTWNPNAYGNELVVYEITVSGDTVYVGGRFGNIGGQPRNRIAALNVSDGLATTWNPGATVGVDSIVVSGSTIYVSGNFADIGGQHRVGIAALDASTGSATPWDPNSNGAEVLSIAVSGNTVYAGGNFISIGGAARNFIAALDATTGLATTWDPNASQGGVEAVVLKSDGSSVYVGGSFSDIGGKARSAFAEINAVTGLAR